MGDRVIAVLLTTYILVAKTRLLDSSVASADQHGCFVISEFLVFPTFQLIQQLLYVLCERFHCHPLIVANLRRE